MKNNEITSRLDKRFLLGAFAIICCIALLYLMGGTQTAYADDIDKDADRIEDVQKEDDDWAIDDENQYIDEEANDEPLLDDDEDAWSDDEELDWDDEEDLDWDDEDLDWDDDEDLDWDDEDEDLDWDNEDEDLDWDDEDEDLDWDEEDDLYWDEDDEFLCDADGEIVGEISCYVDGIELGAEDGCCFSSAISCIKRTDKPHNRLKEATEEAVEPEAAPIEPVAYGYAAIDEPIICNDEDEEAEEAAEPIAEPAPAYAAAPANSIAATEPAAEPEKPQAPATASVGIAALGIVALAVARKLKR